MIASVNRPGVLPFPSDETDMPHLSDQQCQRFRGFVFLDIDGVLNSERSARRYRTCNFLCPRAVQALNYLLLQCELGIVVSSTWRLNASWGQLTRTLRAAGVDDSGDSHLGRYCGKTPRLSELTRGNEIYAWMASFKAICGFPMPFVILDDDGDMDGVSEHWINIDASVGLTHRNAVSAAHSIETQLRRLRAA